jgi:hypothetical protein
MQGLLEVFPLLLGEKIRHLHGPLLVFWYHPKTNHPAGSDACSCSAQGTFLDGLLQLECEIHSFAVAVGAYMVC